MPSNERAAYSRSPTGGKKGKKNEGKFPSPKKRDEKERRSSPGKARRTSPVRSPERRTSPARHSRWSSEGSSTRRRSRSPRRTTEGGPKVDSGRKDDNPRRERNVRKREGRRISPANRSAVNHERGDGSKKGDDSKEGDENENVRKSGTYGDRKVVDINAGSTPDQKHAAPAGTGHPGNGCSTPVQFYGQHGGYAAYGGNPHVFTPGGMMFSPIRQAAPDLSMPPPGYMMPPPTAMPTVFPGAPRPNAPFQGPALPFQGPALPFQQSAQPFHQPAQSFHQPAPSFQQPRYPAMKPHTAPAAATNDRKKDETITKLTRENRSMKKEIEDLKKKSEVRAGTLVQIENLKKKQNELKEMVDVLKKENEELKMAAVENKGIGHGKKGSKTARKTSSKKVETVTSKKEVETVTSKTMVSATDAVNNTVEADAGDVREVVEVIDEQIGNVPPTKPLNVRITKLSRKKTIRKKEEASEPNAIGKYGKEDETSGKDDGVKHDELDVEKDVGGKHFDTELDEAVLKELEREMEFRENEPDDVNEERLSCTNFKKFITDDKDFKIKIFNGTIFIAVSRTAKKMLTNDTDLSLKLFEIAPWSKRENSPRFSPQIADKKPPF